MLKTIVFADDEADIVSLVKARLAKRGYKVIVATNGKEALELIQKHLPDLVILDEVMPVLRGTEVCKQMRSDEKLKSIPVILFTASTANLTPEMLRESGVNDHIIKPFESSELLEKVRSLLVTSGQTKH